MSIFTDQRELLSGISSASRGSLKDMDRSLRTVAERTKTLTGEQAAAIADPAGGGTVDAEARAAINDILAALRSAGLIAT